MERKDGGYQDARVPRHGGVKGAVKMKYNYYPVPKDPMRRTALNEKVLYLIESDMASEYVEIKNLRKRVLTNFQDWCSVVPLQR